MATTVWKGHLTFGLVSIPVRMYKAARAEKVSFHQLYRKPATPKPRAVENGPAPTEPGWAPDFRSAKAQTTLRPVAMTAASATARAPIPEPETEPETLTRVRQAIVPQAEQAEEAEPVSRKDLVKGFEYAKDQYVVIEEEELKNLIPKTATEMEILEFVHFEEIDPVYLETSYYVSAEEAGSKAYALLFEALRSSKYAAVATIAMQRREHVAILRPGKTGIILHTMYYTDEVRADQEYRADTSLVTEKELKLASMLVTSLAASFEPGKYKDTYREKVQQLIDAKVEGKAVAEAKPEKKSAQVVDIMQALEKSLAQLRKPPAGASEPVADQTPAKRTPAKRTAKRA